jgi:exosortase H (IPTLxxWG-CTERM-specific)
MRDQSAADTTTREDHRARLRFALIFAGVAAVLSFAYYFPYRSGSVPEVWLGAYLRAYARCAGAVLAHLDPTVSVSGLNLRGRFPIRISRDCDGMEVNILFASAILAFPTGYKRRLAGLGAGIAILAGANVVRLCTLYFVGVWSATAFDFAHRELWPILFIVIAVGVFATWASASNRPGPVTA